MSEEIKYEPEYGLQKPFDYGPKDATAYGMFGNEILYYKIEKTSVYCFDTDNQWSHVDGAPNVPFLAMRRIIKTPVWTVADQQAGRLPPIGSKYLAGGDRREFTCLFHSKGNGTVGVIGFNSDDEVSGYQIQYCHPIEAPAEKAARLKSEWCAKAAKQLKNLEYTSTLTSIYDALLSGELKAPESTE